MAWTLERPLWIANPTGRPRGVKDFEKGEEDAVILVRRTEPADFHFV